MKGEKRPRFPPLRYATDDGLLLVGGRLTPQWVVEAYRQGIFPWPIIWEEEEILAWFSPDPRAVIELEQLHVSRRLARRIRSGCFQFTCDTDFHGVIRGCAAPRASETGTWITPRMIAVYRQLHREGVVHSIEVWSDRNLVGGLYGVAMGGFFAGESMFHRVRDASKAAMVALVAHLRSRGFALFDIQQTTPHAVRMGATEIPRTEFISRLQEAIALPVEFGRRLDLSELDAMIAPRAAS